MSEEEGELEEKSLMEHVFELLETLRKILIYNVVFIALLFVLPSSPDFLENYQPLIFKLMNITQHQILGFEENKIVAPIARFLRIKSDDIILIAHGWFDSLLAALYLAALLAIVVMGPVTVYLLYKFVEPGLYPHEKRIAKKYMAAIFVLFTTGVVYAYYVIMPLMFVISVWLTVIGGAQPIFSIESFYNTVFLGCVSTGLLFMLPLFLMLLAKLGFVTSETLQKNWRMVVFAVFAVTAIITPDPTPVSMIALSVPFVVLYTISIYLIKRVESSKD